MAKVLTRCPVCEGALGVSELRCRHCKTTIHGAFDSCRFCRLTPEHLGFIETFLRCEGNMSRVEKELGLSYPTVRNRLQAALAALGLTGETLPVTRREASFERAEDTRGEGGEPDRSETAEGVFGFDPAVRRRTVLEALARGDMSAEAAAEALRDLS